MPRRPAQAECGPAWAGAFSLAACAGAFSLAAEIHPCS